MSALLPSAQLRDDYRLVFFFDVDNTLLDNDRVTSDLRHHLDREVGQEHSEHYWKIFEQLRTKLGYADYLGALQRYRIEHPSDPKLLTISYFLVNYPFANRLYPNSLDAIEHCRQWGQVVILSDGDVVFQSLKVVRLLADIQKVWGVRDDSFPAIRGITRSTQKSLRSNPPADISIKRIGGLLEYDLQALLSPTVKSHTA